MNDQASKYQLMVFMRALETATGSKEGAAEAVREAHKSFVDKAPEEIKTMLNIMFVGNLLSMLGDIEEKEED